MQEILHVIHRQGAFHLERSFLLDETLRGKIIVFNDDLRAGPITDLHAESGWDERDNFWTTLYPRAECDLYKGNTNHDFEQLQYVKQALGSDNKIIIWAGHNTRDVLFLSWLLNELRPQAKTINTVQVSEVPILMNGRWVRPSALYLNEIQFAEVGKFVRPLCEAEIDQYSELWKSITESATLLRATEHEVLMNTEVTHFDNALLLFCRPEFQKSAFIVGQALMETDFDVGEVFLNWRLHELVRAGKLNAKGEFGHMREYEISLPQK